MKYSSDPGKSRPRHIHKIHIQSLAAIAAMICATHADARPLGIDVSTFQGSVNWSSVKAAGITFAFAKATEGATFNDSTFVGNQNNGKAAGVYMGAYHFARPGNNSPGTESSHFWNVANDYIVSDGKSFNPVLDFEDFSGHVGATSFTDWANQWCNTIKNNAAATGLTVTPVFYTSSCSACNFSTGVASWTPWLANYNGQDSQTGTPWSTCTSCAVWGAGVWSVWQYTSSGAVSGVSGNVDRDVFNGSTVSAMTTKLLVKSTYGGSSVGFYNPADGSYHLRNSLSFGSSDYAWTAYSPPVSGAIPVTGDWDGNHQFGTGYYNPADGSYHLKDGLSPGSSDYAWVAYSPPVAGIIPVTGDWNGDGKTSVGFYNPADGSFHLKNSLAPGSSDYAFVYGPPNMVPLIGDWDGNGIPGVGYYNPADGTVHLRNSLSAGPSDYAYVFISTPNPAYKVITGDWNADHKTSVGYYDPTDGSYHLRNSLSPGPSDYAWVAYNPPTAGIVPLSGDWDGQ